MHRPSYIGSMESQGKKYNLEDRLIQYSSCVVDLVEALPTTKAGTYIAGQLIRCGLAPALNYAEAQSAESRSDFVHKMKTCLKELKETSMCVKLVLTRKLCHDQDLLLDENEQLIAIFAKSIDTAKSNQARAD